MTRLLFLLALIPTLGYASPQGIPIHTTKVVSTANITVLSANPNRGYLIIQNNGSGNCQLKFGTSITGTEGMILGAGLNFEPNQAYIKSALYMKCTVSGSSICLLESNW